MFKKILVILGSVVVCAIFSGYFWCAGRYARQQAGLERCGHIDVIITNPQVQNFISEDEVAGMVESDAVGVRTGEIDTYAIERKLCLSSAVCKAEAYIKCPSTLTLEVTQRNPVVRFMTTSGGFYCDSSGYLLPLLGKVTLDLPVVSGHIPLEMPGIRGGYPESGRQWLADMLDLCELIRINSYWSKEIEQIWIEGNYDIVLFTRSCDEKFIFGSAHDAADKLRKMAGYYRTIRPEARAKGKNYTTVNLKYKDQIICK